MESVSTFRPRAAITGAVSGIGAEIAVQLASAGHDPILLNRSAARTEPLVARLRREVPDAHVTVLEMDVTDPGGVAAAAARIDGPLAVLVNNAGILPAERAKIGGQQAEYAVNTLGAARVTRALWPNLAEGRGTVAFLSSGAIKMCGPLDPAKLEQGTKPGLMGAYGQSKLALSALMAAWAEAAAKDGIRLLAVDPGGNRTAMTAGAGASWGVRAMHGLLPKPEKGAAKVTGAIAAEHPTGTLTMGGRPVRLGARTLPDAAVRATVAKIEADLAASG
ncbi:MAG: SDR family NAD(P)-dependent oxidoreductase [Shimia sp.]